MLNLSVGILSFAIFLISCENYPEDERGTLKEVTGNTLIAGVTENSPYIILKNGNPSGLEADMIRYFAKDIGAGVEWITGSEETILLLLENGKIHIAAGGFSMDNVWKKRVHFVHPYDTVIYKWGVPDGTSLPDDLKNKTVYALKGSVAPAFVPEKTKIVYKDSLEGTEPVVVDEEKELIRKGFIVSDKKLKEKHFSLAIRNGENAFLKELEKSQKKYGRRN